MNEIVATTKLSCPGPGWTAANGEFQTKRERAHNNIMTHEARNELRPRPARQPAPVHSSITEDQISDLVDRFYERVWVDPRLGPIFAGRIGDNRDAHLAKMKRFWSSVLLRTRTFEGRPVPAHVKLTEVQSEDFRIWLGHFHPIAAEVFSTEAAPLVSEMAERIAKSLWLAMFSTPTLLDPEWAASTTANSPSTGSKSQLPKP
ncbi:MAG: group III truncated hemoglobin [Alphaproteobacteria bacterium]|nr:group III truncated hemoglobin [Alphaproteobacteria bacterium]